MARYVIEFVEFSGGHTSGSAPFTAIDPYEGYMPDDFVPGFRDKVFDTVEEAEAYLSTSYKPPDSAGFYAMFKIVPLPEETA